MALEIGQAAPGFALKSEHGEVVELSAFQGEKNVALVFYPFAFSGLCSGELCEIRDNLAAFEDGAVQVLAVSCDPMFSLRNWADIEKFAFPLLSDFWPHGAVAKEYGVFNESTGSAVRGTFLIDKEGVLRWSVVNGMGEPRSLEGYREAIAAL
ncbi:peroxiredoxin [Kineosporia rhizophila]|uniref:peroxiredoxin n=1 Tax=Kineosporia TaxID=49184 RepID=UPI000AF69737|nr:MULTISPECIES: peroxiredoxin [Kineosporia]MCE0538828.1 peroxiredoxin [Kineosporia rhizophila]GLY18746.1 peroxiredoxin [Kineosporia sp. NBRC 101677]